MLPKDKIKFIADNAEILNSGCSILNYINRKQINYSENINGRFINLSLLKDEEISDIYTMVIDILKNDKYENNVNIQLDPRVRSENQHVSYLEIKLTALQIKMITYSY